MKRGIILIITTLLILSTVSANMKTQIIAHRTNTIEKINQAIKTMEKPFVEIDVIKQDNQFIASHDKNPKNITTIKARLRIIKITFSVIIFPLVSKTIFKANLQTYDIQYPAK